MLGIQHIILQSRFQTYPFFIQKDIIGKTIAGFTVGIIES